MTTLSKPRKNDVARRNITLRTETYSKLDRFLLDLMHKKGDPTISRNDAIEALLEEHYSKK